MHDHHESGASFVATTGVVAAIACAVCVAVAIFHARHLAVAVRSRKPVQTSIEMGHLTVAVGMAVMFAAPGALGAPGFTWAYLGVALVFLALVVAHPHSSHPHHWWCHSMLFVEAVAMAAMSGSGGWWAAGLADWFVAAFLVAAVVAAGRIVLRRTALAGGGGDLPTVAGSQLAMSVGMLVMLL